LKIAFIPPGDIAAVKNYFITGRLSRDLLDGTESSNQMPKSGLTKIYH